MGINVKKNRTYYRFIFNTVIKENPLPIVSIADYLVGTLRLIGRIDYPAGVSVAFLIRFSSRSFLIKSSCSSFMRLCKIAGSAAASA